MVAQVVIELVASAAVFLLAAKLHGRALRLEREAEGIMSVSFRGGNPPFVTELWRRERWIFWGTAAVAAAVMHLVGVLVWPARYVLVPMIVGFTVGGVASALRLRRRRR